MQDRIEARRQRLVVSPVRVQPRRVLGMRRNMRLDLGAPIFRQLAVEPRVEIGFPHVRAAHFTTLRPAAPGTFSSMMRRRSRARDSRDMTVPIGMPSAVAVC